MDSANLNFRIAVDAANVAPATAQIGQGFEKAAVQATNAVNSINASVKTLNADSAKPIVATQNIDALGKTAASTSSQTAVLGTQLRVFYDQVSSGQAPLTALIQQGSQLTGSLGGVGGALSALGSLINPVTVGIGAIAAVAGVALLAHRQGAAEARAYNEAIALTGNVAGVTRGQLDQMAQGIGRVVGTQGAAAEALAQLAGSGLVAGNNLQQFAQHAIEMQRTVGRSVTDTVAIFTELGKSPVQASLKLNETTNYLTASLYNQIKALEEQGRKTEAASVAQKAFANAENERVKGLESNLGTIEKALRSGSDAWKRFWDSAMSLGRQDSVESMLQKTQANVAALQKTFDARTAAGSGTGDIAPRLAAATALLDIQKEGAKIAARAAQIQTDGVATDRAKLDFSIAMEGSETRREKMAKAIQTANGLATQAGASEADRAKLLAGVYEKFKDVTAKGVDAEIEIIRQGEKAKEEVIKRSLIEVQAARKMGQISDVELIQQTTALTLSQLDVKRGALVQELALAKTKTDNAKEVAALTGQIAEVDAQKITEKLKGEKELAIALDIRKKKIQDVMVAEIEEAQIATGKDITNQLAKWNQTLTIVNEYAKAIQLANDQTAFEGTLLGQTQKQRDIAIGQRRVELQLEIEKLKIGNADLTFKQQQDLIARAETAAAAAKAGVVAKAALDESQQILSSFEQSAHTVWTTVTQGGQDIWSKIKNTAKTVLFDWLYQMLAKPFILNIGANLLGVSGTASATSTVSSIASGASGANSLMGLSGSAGGFMNGLSAWGEGGSVMGMMSNPGLYSGMELLGAAAPYIAAAVLAYSLISDGGTKPSIEGGYSTAGDPGTNGKAYVNGFYGGALDNSSKTVVTGMTSSYANTVRAVGGKAGTFTASEFTGIDQNGHASAIDMSAYVNGKAVYNRYADLGTNKVGSSDAEVSAALDLGSKKSLVSALQATDLGPVLNDYLKNVTVQGKSIEEINAILADVTSVGAFEKALKGLPFDNLANASVETIKALAEAAGGMSNLQQQVGSYYGNFYSESERAAITTKNVTSALGEVGLTMPKTRAEFRALVDAQDLTTEAGRRNYAALMANADAFAQVTPAAADAAAAITRSASDIASETQGLQQKLWQLTGNTAAIREAELAKLDPSNQALQTRIWLLEDEAKITNEAAGLQKQLWTLQGDTVSLRAAELAKLDPANRAMQQRVWTLQDEAKVTNEALGLQNQLWTVQGDTVSLRAAELAKLDPANRAMQLRIWKLQDEKNATEAAAAAHTKAIDLAKAAVDRAAAAEKIRVQAMLDVAQQSVSTLTGLFDLLASNIKDLYSQVDSTAAMSAAAGQQFIEQALSTANATGYMPDQQALTEAIASVRAGFDKTVYANQFEEDKARLVLAGELAQLKAKAGTQLSTAEQQLTVAKNQLSGIDDMLTAAQKQIDAINGVDTSVISLGQAIQAWLAASRAPTSTAATGTTASTAAPGTHAASFGGGSGGAVTPVQGGAYTRTTGLGMGGVLVSSFDDPAAFITGLDWGNPSAVAQSVSTTVAVAKENNWSQAFIAEKLGLPLETVQSNMSAYGFSAFADGGLHSGGLRLVGERGPELEVTGPARYWDAATTAAMLGGSASGTKSSDGSIEEVRLMRDDLRHQFFAMTQALIEMRRIYKSWDALGMPATRTVVTA